jgi:hypothetical protein
MKLGHVQAQLILTRHNWSEGTFSQFGDRQMPSAEPLACHGCQLVPNDIPHPVGEWSD